MKDCYNCGNYANNEECTMPDFKNWKLREGKAMSDMSMFKKKEKQWPEKFIVNTPNRVIYRAVQGMFFGTGDVLWCRC